MFKWFGRKKETKTDELAPQNEESKLEARGEPFIIERKRNPPTFTVNSERYKINDVIRYNTNSLTLYRSSAMLENLRNFHRK